MDRGYLGALLAPITQDMAEELKLESRKGALVAAVEKGGPAAQAGLKPGDVIVRVDDKPINDDAQLTRAIGQHQPGSILKLEVVREGKVLDMQVKLAQRPDEAEVSRRTCSESVSRAAAVHGRRVSGGPWPPTCCQVPMWQREHCRPHAGKAVSSFRSAAV